jgi:hypothetical protein
MLMPVTQADIDRLSEEWTRITKRAEKYFDDIGTVLRRVSPDAPMSALYQAEARQHLTESDFQLAGTLIRDIARLVNRVVEFSRSSPLLADEDRIDLRHTMRELISSIDFRVYRHWPDAILNDEDRVLGVQRASQSEQNCTHSEAVEEFRKAREKLESSMVLLVPSNTPEATAIARSDATVSVKKYRPNTAFIMMWISKVHPELEDVKDCYQEVFKKFGIKAVRADEIEHSEQITQRILDEISTAEFLVADLTGERTSVYYEVGYAHALGKRPILYRRSGTKIGFDLVVHNCPEYANVVELRKKLEARLEALTNKNAVE